MRSFSATPLEMIASLWRNRELIRTFARREVLGRYRGSVLGLLWSFVNPLIMLMIYTFVFSVVFSTRWGSGAENKAEFALLLFAGLLVFNLFVECINRAPGLISSTPNYVKKIVFPLEILPFVSFAAALYHAMVSLIVWLVAYTMLIGMPHLTVFYLPLIFVPFGLLIVGLCWVLSSLGVYLRDVSQVIGVFTAALMFISPVFYPVTALPELYRNIMYLNPLAVIIEQTRNVLFWGCAPDFLVLGVYWAITLFIAWLGFFWFQKTRRGFADVL
ncbi:sugar ABC transporter permease [Aquipseudomonas alcaligenes]|uniref:Transport permease protein n=1 Tax=Aquipseudomonas alcaligenes TaxID=43263 RepID=A0A2V4L163_AQUAC|nr:ABC transporter permease [Pseudomonas alcaligenes]PYC25618.1 sugar ABC transporter permease [Pseudomonas alcaligenes]